MIIYENNKRGFFDDIRNNVIADNIETAFRVHNINHNNLREHISWSNSLNFMRNVLDDSEISDECKLAIEYQVPLW